MGIFDTSSSSSNAWNYTDNTKDDFSSSIIGEVIAIEEVQAINFQTKQPEFWQSGNPKLVMRWTLLTSTGEEKTWTFNWKATSRVAASAIEQAFGPNPEPNAILGKVIQIETQDGNFGANNPRPFRIQIIQDGDPNAIKGYFKWNDPNHPRHQYEQEQQQNAAWGQPQQGFTQQTQNNSWQQPQQQASTNWQNQSSMPQGSGQQWSQPAQQPMQSQPQQQQQQAWQQPAQAYSAPTTPVADSSVSVYDQDIPF